MERCLPALALLVVVACSQPPAPAREPAPERPETTASLPQRCSNPASGFSVSYPAGWVTNDGSVMPACSVFDPDGVELPPQSEIPFDIAVIIGVEDHPFAPFATSTPFEKVLSSRRMKIAGRDAVRVESEATGEGLADRGMRSLRFVLDLGAGRTLVATTHDTGDEYADQKEILARMVETLSFP